MRILVVESPAKSKTIGKYLGSDYIVLPSFGHIRDIPSKSNSVDVAHNFDMTWELSKKGQEFINKLKKAITKADELLLATDPDREGEAISWHIIECLKKEVDLSKIAVKRVAFHEITKQAVLAAINSPRDIDYNLVNAYLARRVLDYLFGFTLSPLLWRRLPGCKSAGRVQSVALRILVDRENEIDEFKSEEFWSVDAVCNANNMDFLAHLTKLNGKRLSKLSIKKQTEAEDAKRTVQNSEFSVASVEKRTIKKSPPPPFITSTLQQEASRKLGYSAKKTMQLAQQLYEGVDIGGETKALITYMRTDSLNLSEECIGSTRKLIKDTYGDKYLPQTANRYKSKVKNAQEAHEAIRPIDPSVTPQNLTGILESSLLKLYTLIWKRTLACQMNKAEINRTQINLADQQQLHELRATGSILIFDGYLKVYEEGHDDSADSSDDTQKLPDLTEGERVLVKEVTCDQHFTQPPARYTEASLVKKMEELGIGRPSTYATVIQVLQTRQYAVLNKRTFFPELKGRFVISFLKSYCPEYVEYNFTANMEEDLDEISNNQKSWNLVLTDFWNGLYKNSQDIKKITLLDVIRKLTDDMPKILFNDKEENRKCPKCGNELTLKLWSTAAYVGCSSYPECDYRRLITGDEESASTEGGKGTATGRSLGNDPATGYEMLVKTGPYGPYVELQSPKAKKRVSIPKDLKAADLTTDQAAFLISLPKVVGQSDGKDITIGIGRYGPYVLFDGKFRSVKTTEELMRLQ